MSSNVRSVAVGTYSNPMTDSCVVTSDGDADDEILTYLFNVSKIRFSLIDTPPLTYEDVDMAGSPRELSDILYFASMEEELTRLGKRKEVFDVTEPNNASRDTNEYNRRNDELSASPFVMPTERDLASMFIDATSSSPSALSPRANEDAPQASSSSVVTEPISNESTRAVDDNRPIFPRRVSDWIKCVFYDIDEDAIFRFFTEDIWYLKSNKRVYYKRFLNILKRFHRVPSRRIRYNIVVLIFLKVLRYKRIHLFLTLAPTLVTPSTTTTTTTATPNESPNDNVCCVCLEMTQYVTKRCNHQLCPRCLLTVVKSRRKAFMVKVPSVYTQKGSRLAHFRVREFNKTNPYACPMCRSCMNDVIESRIEFESMDQEYDRLNANAQISRYLNRTRRASNDPTISGTNYGNTSGRGSGGSHQDNDFVNEADPVVDGQSNNSWRNDSVLSARGGNLSRRAMLRVNLPIENSTNQSNPASWLSPHWVREIQNRIAAVEDHTDSDDMDFDVSEEASSSDGISTTINVNLLDDLDGENVEYFVQYFDFS